MGARVRWYVFLRCDSYELVQIHVQSTLVISNSKGLSEMLRDIRTSTYQICRIADKIIRTTTYNEFIGNWALEVRDIVKNIGEKRRNCSSPLFHNIFHLLLDFHVRDKIFTSRYAVIRDKRGRDNESQLYTDYSRNILRNMGNCSRHW